MDEIKFQQDNTKGALVLDGAVLAYGIADGKVYPTILFDNDIDQDQESFLRKWWEDIRNEVVA